MHKIRRRGQDALRDAARDIDATGRDQGQGKIAGRRAEDRNEHLQGLDAQGIGGPGPGPGGDDSWRLVLNAVELRTDLWVFRRMTVLPQEFVQIRNTLAGADALVADASPTVLQAFEQVRLAGGRG